MYKKVLGSLLIFVLCLVGAPSGKSLANEQVNLSEIIVKWGGIVETEPNYSIKANAGKFAPQELEYGLFLKPDMKYGYGNVNGMMAPLRDMIEALPGNFEWDGKIDSGTITINLNEDELIYTLGSTTAKLNGKDITIPSTELAPYAVQVEDEVFEDGSDYYAFYLPVKFTAEAFGAQVMWNEPMRRVEIGWMLYYQEKADEPTIGGDYTTAHLEGNGVPMDRVNKNAETLTNAIKAALNVVGFQNTDGGWQKTNAGYDLLRDDFLAKLAPLNSTIDNGATFGENRYLARVLKVMKEAEETNSPLYRELEESIAQELKENMPNTLVRLEGLGRLDSENPTYDSILASLENSFWDSMHYFLDSQVLFYGDENNSDTPTSGGWAQYYPYSIGYYKNITYNDNAMTSVLETLMDVIYDTDTGSNFWDDFSWVREETNKEDLEEGDIPVAHFQRAFDLGVRYTLDAQIEVEGYGLTGWSQQYDRTKGQPTMGRAYEHPSIATGESARVMLFLTKIRPSEIVEDSLFTFNEVADSVVAYYEWTQFIPKTGLSTFTVTDRTREIAGDRFVSPLIQANGESSDLEFFGRFYSLNLNQDNEFDILFSNRDSVVIYNHNDVYHERRSGYSFTNTGTKNTAAAYYNNWRNEGGNGYGYTN
jgi:PelA/Pel-15E family pectate lyase